MVQNAEFFFFGWFCFPLHFIYGSTLVLFFFGWSIFGFWGILVIFRFWGYFG